MLLLFIGFQNPRHRLAGFEAGGAAGFVLPYYPAHNQHRYITRFVRLRSTQLIEGQSPCAAESNTVAGLASPGLCGPKGRPASLAWRLHPPLLIQTISRIIGSRYRKS